MARYRNPEYREAQAKLRTAERVRDVGRDLARLQGRSRNDLTRDDVRGPASPLGGGKRSEQGRGR